MGLKGLIHIRENCMIGSTKVLNEYNKYQGSSAAGFFKISLLSKCNSKFPGARNSNQEFDQLELISPSSLPLLCSMLVQPHRPPWFPLQSLLEHVEALRGEQV